MLPCQCSGPVDRCTVPGMACRCPKLARRAREAGQKTLIYLYFQRGYFQIKEPKEFSARKTIRLEEKIRALNSAFTALSGTMCLPTGSPMPARERIAADRPINPLPPMIRVNLAAISPPFSVPSWYLAMACHRFPVLPFTPSPPPTFLSLFC